MRGGVCSRVLFVDRAVYCPWSKQSNWQNINGTDDYLMMARPCSDSTTVAFTSCYILILIDVRETLENDADAHTIVANVYTHLHTVRRSICFFLYFSSFADVTASLPTSCIAIASTHRASDASRRHR